MRIQKSLNIAPADKNTQKILSSELKISNVLAQILINRGINDPSRAEEFLAARLGDLLDPYSFSDMPKAVSLIKQAAGNKGKVMICGDYDVDGITSLALLKETFSKMGVEALHYIPHRIKDGYGLNKKVVDIAKENKVSLLVTADCGTSNHQEIKELRLNNTEVIVTDHHQPADCNLPPVSAIINPKLKGCNYKYKDLAGVGVAYKLCQALAGDILAQELDLVSLGTIADVVPLTGENRIIVKEGLSRLAQTKRAGINALVEISRIKNRKIDTTFVSFILGPRINASGRVDTAEAALSLLMSEEKEEADRLAVFVDKCNRQRQKIESQIFDEAEDLINQEINFKEHRVIVLAKEGWHQGVLGIVASKIMGRFYRPTILISLTDDLCKGSGRSIKNFHLFDALLKCKDFLKNFGGHRHAVGLVINRKSIADFKDSINRLAHEELNFEDLIPRLEIDMELSLSDLSEKLVEELEVLEPFGEGNPEPLFYTRKLKIKSQPQVLGRDTLKFWVTDGSVSYPAIGFGMGSLRDSLLEAAYCDLAYTLKIDKWQNYTSVLLEIKEIFLEYKS